MLNAYSDEMHRKAGIYRRVVIVVAGVLALCGLMQGAAHSTEMETAPRYIFSWPVDAAESAPRGGTTKGVPVTLDKNPSTQWQALQAQDIDSFERDRRAILAMAGT